MRDLQDLGYFLLIVTFKQVEGQHGAVAVWQEGHGLFDLLYFQCPFFFVRLFLVRQVADIRLFDVDQVHPAFAEQVDRLVDDDPFQPRTEGRLVVKVLQRSECIGEGFLQDVFRVTNNDTVPVRLSSAVREPAGRTRMS